MAVARRLDLELVHRGIFESREKAQRSILAGEIWVNEQRCDKASVPCPPAAAIEVRGGDKYVGRGGHKLEGALNHFQINPKGWRCLDIGASTGGFTDCLLQRDAAKVVAIDVGHGQLAWKIRQDPRVDTHEKLNARFLEPGQLGDPFDLIVTDVSFISLRLILPPAFSQLKKTGLIVALIKPQFEAGKEQVGKGGIVRDEAVRRQVIDGLLAWVADFPVVTRGVIPSPIAGMDGNQEYLWCMERS